MKLFTIGFTQKTAEEFFTALKRAGVVRVIDTRLNNRSQLAGFSKADDLPYLLRAIGSMDYRHATELAPTQAMLDEYKKQRGSWTTYEAAFNTLLQSRRIEVTLDRAELVNACLLCSEHPPIHCHRRLVAEYLQREWRDVEVVHLPAGVA